VCVLVACLAVAVYGQAADPAASASAMPDLLSFGGAGATQGLGSIMGLGAMTGALGMYT